MEKAFSKKQYVILLVVSAVLSIIIPMVFALFGPSDNASFKIYSCVGSIFPVAAYAIFVFVCLRCRFEWCLPFLAVSFIGYIRYGVSLEQIWTVFVTIAMFFAFLGIAKLSGKLIKNEIVAALVALVLVYILDHLFFAADVALSFLMIRHFPNDIITSIFTQMVTPLWSPILSVVCMFVTYFIIRQIFRRAAPVTLEAGRGEKA